MVCFTLYTHTHTHTVSRIESVPQHFRSHSLPFQLGQEAQQCNHLFSGRDGLAFECARLPACLSVRVCISKTTIVIYLEISIKMGNTFTSVLYGETEFGSRIFSEDWLLLDGDWVKWILCTFSLKQIRFISWLDDNNTVCGSSACSRDGLWFWNMNEWVEYICEWVCWQNKVEWKNESGKLFNRNEGRWSEWAKKRDKEWVKE